MATTESRTGFRLPWSADRPSSREESGELETHPVANDGGPGSLEPDGLPAVAEPGPSSTASTSAPAGSLPGGTTRPGPAPVPGQALEPAPAPARRRPPTGFLADLMKAMHTAAETARTASLDQFRADGKAFVEQVHARAAGQADALRRRTDEDITAIRDWSKAEIARVRAEAEARTTARRRLLDDQLERHAALIEREIEKVQARVAGYESEMGSFFDELLREEDPAGFAARAALLPEPPSFEAIDEQAMAELLAEPAPDVVPAEGTVEPPAEGTAAAEPGTVTDEPGTAGDEPGTAGDEPAAATGATAGLADATFPALEPADRESAMAAIQAAAQAAQAAEAGAERDEAEVDPRIAMLGLTPDFAAAEAEAAAAAQAATAGDAFEEMGEDSVSARLAGLVPADGGTGPAPTPAPAVGTQVVVVGLVSVASIASFKRHLGRLAGVQHVGVSSGPDGEFVFTVMHTPEVALRDVVPTFPGFAARVTGTGDGIVNVTANDPED